MPKLSIDASLRGKVRVGVGLVLGINNEGDVGELLASAMEEARARYTLDGLRDNPVIRAYRDFYWRELGIDPTKQRPSQEALLRRILRGEGLPRINPAVDIGNAVSITYLVPVGLYDIDKFHWRDLVFRYSRDGEEFVPIGSSPRRLSGNQIVLSTVDNLILHVYPHRDSEVTKVDGGTKNILVITAGVPGVADEALLSSVKRLGELLTKHLGGDFRGGVLLTDTVELS